MRAVTGPVAAYLAARRGAADAVFIMCDLFTVTPVVGAVIRVTSADVDVMWNGFTFRSDFLLVSGLKFKHSVGLDVDSQQITIGARDTDTTSGTNTIQSIAEGLLDGAAVMRERAFFSAWGTAPIGTVILFTGHVATVDRIGRLEAQLTVHSDLDMLDINMPRNKYGPACSHTLYDARCTLSKATFSASGTMAAGSTTTVLNWASSSAVYAQGTIAFTSGANNGARRAVKSATASTFTLAYPLSVAPTAGDTFTISQGCDHTRTRCQVFGNLANWRGFDLIPPSSAVL